MWVPVVSRTPATGMPASGKAWDPSAAVALTGLALVAVWFWDASPIVKRLSLWPLAAACLGSAVWEP